MTGTASVGALDMAGPQMVSFAMDLNALGVAGQTYAVDISDEAQVTFQPRSQLSAPSVGIGSNGLASELTFVESFVSVAGQSWARRRAATANSA